MSAMKFTAIQRDKFLRERAVRTQAMKLNNPKGVIVVDAEDFVLCDVCNSEVPDELLWVTDWGLYCLTCRKDK